MILLSKQLFFKIQVPSASQAISYTTRAANSALFFYSGQWIFLNPVSIHKFRAQYTEPGPRYYSDDKSYERAKSMTYICSH